MIRRVLLLGLALGMSGCVHGAALFGTGSRQPSAFETTLATARSLASAGDFAASDRELQRYAREHAGDPSTAEVLYWRALLLLDPANQSRSLDTAITQLDAYLAGPRPLQHLSEATTLRDLAHDAQELDRVQAALHQARAEARANADQSAGNEDSAKEIQRLRDELAAANAELDRIKKRLANPKP
jgi:hypothetical protein